MRPRGRLVACLLCAALPGASVAARAAEPEAPGLALAPLPSPPEPGPPVGWGIGAGTLTALLPLSIGASLFASTTDPDRRNAASLAIAYGLALSPIVSHLVVREWSRAGIFGAIPVACAVGLTVLVELQPTVTFFGTRAGRWTYGLLLSFTTLSAGIGLFDTLGARGRARERRAARRARLPVLPSPFVTQGGGGLVVGGAF